MTDQFDRASEIEQQHREDALERRKAVPSCTRCIDCETRVEARNRIARANATRVHHDFLPRIIRSSP